MISMKKLLLTLPLLLLIFSCKQKSSEIISGDESSTTEEIAFSNLNYAELWDAFRFGIVNNNPDFDWYKFVEIEGQDPNDYASFFEDDYTRLVLENTSYEYLEDAQYNGVDVKLFQVVVAADNDLFGNKYYFRESSYGLFLIGIESF